MKNKHLHKNSYCEQEISHLDGYNVLKSTLQFRYGYGAYLPHKNVNNFPRIHFLKIKFFKEYNKIFTRYLCLHHWLGVYVGLKDNIPQRFIYLNIIIITTVDGTV